MTSSVDVKSYRDIRGWFAPVDRLMFDWILSSQSDLTGSLVELGAYLGRSAVIIADHKRADERFIVVDLFGSDAGLADDRNDAANKRENERSYRSLSRQRFEENFLALHPELPEVVQGLSSLVVDHVEPKSARFVHIDASHIYDKVAEDIANVRNLILPQGVVVLDDFRAPHTPGVAAATWEAIREDGLNPFVITDRKLYATWGDPAPYHELLVRKATGHRRMAVQTQPLREHQIARIFTPQWVRDADAKTARERKAADAAKVKVKATADAKAKADAELEAAAKAKAAAPAPLGKRLARDLTPPVVARWARRRRRERAARRTS